MRRFPALLLGWGLALAALTNASDAQDRDVLLDRFETLKSNSLAALKEDKAETVETQIKGTTDKLRLVGRCTIPPAPPVAPVCPQPIQLGVKIWGQLLDGRFVNLSKHKWQRQERFYLWLETAAPIQLAFFQNYPDGQPASRQISPDDRFPQTFATIMPGKPYRFPVQLATDDNLIDEHVSFVVVRADAQVLPCNGAPLPTGSATAIATAIVNTNTLPPGSTITIDAQAAAATGQAQANAASLSAIQGPGGTMKGEVLQKTKEVLAELNNFARNQPKTKSARLKLSLVGQPPAGNPPVAQNPNDVAILLMGPGKVAQIELTLHKD